MVSYKEIQEAYNRIKPYINKTPVMTSSYINSLIEGELFFKCENFQKVGAFKYRGAINALLSLNKTELKNGIATHSSGNHAAALALAAKNLNTKAYIVMPENAPKVKKEAVKNYGGIITFCKPTLKDRENSLKKIVEKTNAKFIHPYDNDKIIAGQGTCGLELLSEITNLDSIIAPVGGGGLLSGISIAAKSIKKEIKVYAAEPKNADDAYKSLKSNKLVPSINPDTIADGLLTSLSDRTFSIIQQNVDDILLVDEDEIKQSMLLIWQRMKIIIEPSSATVLAAVLKNKDLFKNKKTGLVLSGGNVDLKDIYKFFPDFT